MVDTMEFSTEMSAKELDAIKKGKFDYTTLVSLLKETTSDLSDINPELFWKILIEVVKIFNEMSSALSIAFQDITSKVAIMQKNYNDFGHPKIGLLGFVQKEMGLNIHILNSHNNKRHTKDPKYAKYESTARSLLRMTWLLDFMSVLLGSLGKDPQASASECARKAYTTALGPHHPFFLRQIAKLGMSAAPSRKNFEKKIFPGVEPKQICDILNVMTEEIDKLRSVLWKFYTQNQLTELP